MCDEMVSAFDMLDRDDRVKAIVVTGKGKMFCAGADLVVGLHGGWMREIRMLEIREFPLLPDSRGW